MDRKYTLRYASLQAAYWLGAVCMLTFAERFLLERGYTEAGIGILLAIGYAVALVAEPMASSLADSKAGLSLRTLISAGFLLLALSATGLYFCRGKLLTGVLFIVASIVSLTLLPLINAVSFFYVNKGIHADFSFGRGIGSAAFVLSSFFGGKIVAKVPDRSMWILLLSGILGVLFAILFAPGEKGSAEKEETTKGIGLAGILKKYPDLRPLLAANTCLMASHIFLNAYMLNIIAPTGHGVETIGTLAAIGAIAELPILFGFSKIAQKIRIETMLVAAPVMFSVKIGLSLLPTFAGTGIWIMYVEQLLQMFALAIFLPASSIYINSKVTADDQAKGQMLLTETQVLGTVICTLLGGIGITRIGIGMTTVGFLIIGSFGILFSALAVRKK